MANISLLERLRAIIELIKSQSFFITLFVILLLTIIVLVVNMRVKSKAPKYAVAIVYTGLAILILARYGHYVLSLNDSIVDKFFRAMYFPNIVVYLSMLILSILFLIVAIINDKFLTYTKISSFLSFFVIWFLFVLTVDSVKKAGLSFYEVSQIYADSTIMILMQASMCVFTLWCGVLLSDIIIRKLSDKMEKNNTQLVVESKDDDIVEEYNGEINTNDLNSDINYMNKL